MDGENEGVEAAPAGEAAAANAPAARAVPAAAPDEVPDSETPTGPLVPAVGATAASKPGDDDPAPLPPLDSLMPTDDDGLIRVRHKRSRKGRTRKRVLISLAVIVVVLGLAVGGGLLFWQMSVKRGEEKLLEEVQQEVETDTITYNGKKYRRNKDIVSIAIIGFDSTDESRSRGAAGQADAVMVMALNTKTGAMRVIAIPRDSMVAIDEYDGERYLGQTTAQLCLAFGYGDGGPTSSEHTVDAISRVLLSQPISYYFSIDMSGVDDINDSVGGVTLTPVESVPTAGIYEGQKTTLRGDAALKYLQWRDTARLDSSLGRMERQKQYISAFATELLSHVKAGDISALVNLYNTASSYAVTNLGFDEFSYLATTVASHGVRGLSVTSLSGELSSSGTFAEIQLDAENVKKTVVETYYTPVEESAQASDAKE